MRLGYLVVLSAVLLLGACAVNERREALEKTLDRYAALIRWNQFAAAADFYDPALRDTDPITSLEMRRLKQFRVSGYRRRSFWRSPDGTRVRQAVEIRLYNIHTQVAETVIDRQTWRYDAEAERWWLTSGLPDVTQNP